MNNLKTLLILAAVCISLQIVATRCEAKALDKVKGAAKELATKSADNVAAGAPEVEKTGGVRQTVLHTGVDMAVDKGLTVLENTHPAMRIAVPLARKFAAPAISKAHEKINNMFTGNSTSSNEDSDSSADDSSSTEDAASDDDSKTEASDNETTTESGDETATEAEDDATTTTETADTSSTEKPGLLSKIKGAIKGGEKKADDESQAKEDTKQ